MNTILRHVFAEMAALLLFAVTATVGQSLIPQQNQLPDAPDAQRSTNSAQSQSGKAHNEKLKSQKRRPCPKKDLNCQENASAEEKQTSRMFWIVPNFTAVSPNEHLPPETPKQKFIVAMHDSVDYSSFVWAGIVAAQSMALKNYPELAQGAAGYGRYYWRAFVDQASGALFTEAIVPVLTHEDPRYFTLGHGGFFKRTGYAIAQIVLTRLDNGKTGFNMSEVGGNALVAGLSNAYYPPQERGLRPTVVNWATQIESAGLNNIVKEFWPDIRRKLLRQK